MINWIKNLGKKTSGYTAKLVSAEEIKGNASFIKEAGSLLLLPGRAIKNSRVETFDEAVRRQGLTEKDLIQVHFNYSASFYISAFFGAICLALFSNALVAGSIMYALSTLAIFLVCLANAFRFSFRTFQIRHKKLCSVSEWFSRRNEWFPPLNK
jgi:hypothetical protein